MIFRNSNGHLIEINKYDYPNDEIYYEKVMKLNVQILPGHDMRVFENLVYK
jgi:hypothetical protein